jgi:hypothetical protein
MANDRNVAISGIASAFTSIANFSRGRIEKLRRLVSQRPIFFGGNVSKPTSGYRVVYDDKGCQHPSLIVKKEK